MTELRADEVRAFNRDGFVVLKNFFDLDRDIEPIQQSVYRIIGVVIKKYKLAIARPSFAPEVFDAGYQELIAVNRSYGAEIYDAVKQIPGFIRLVGHPAHEKIFCQLRSTALAGVAAGGFGIRIDNPNEDRFRANWHQEYPAQLRSIDGLVFWSPLLAVTKEMGPVEFCNGSHVAGPVPVFTQDKNNPDKQGAYSLTLKNEEALVSKYQRVSPLTVPGDLIVMDFLLLHASGENRSNRSRWSMQYRYFNFADPTGMSYAWKGSFAAGVDFRKIHPELCAD